MNTLTDTLRAALERLLDGAWHPMEHAPLVALRTLEYVLCRDGDDGPEAKITDEGRAALLRCRDCNGTGRIDGDECARCEGTCHDIEAALGTDAALEADTPMGTDDDGAGLDGEPPDIDDDRFTNPYTGTYDDEGYDTGGDW